MFVHEDRRRKIIEWASGQFRVAKALVAKAGCVVGDHYHRNKDEEFLLLSGSASLVVVGGQSWRDVPAPCKWIVPRGHYHRFELSEGSVLLGVGTEEYDEADEIKGEPNSA